MSEKTFNLYLDMASGKEHSFVITNDKLRIILTLKNENPRPFIFLDNDFDGMLVNFEMVEAFTYKQNEK